MLFLANFSILGRTSGALEANFFITKAAYTTKSKTPDINWFFVSNFEATFVVFYDLGGSGFKHRFGWVLELTFYGCWLSFDTIFWYVVILIGTFSFSHFWQPFHSKTRFLQIQGFQSLHIFDMFCWLRFKFVFYEIVLHFWGHLRLHLAPFLKKTFRKSL